MKKTSKHHFSSIIASINSCCIIDRKWLTIQNSNINSTQSSRKTRIFSSSFFASLKVSSFTQVSSRLLFFSSLFLLKTSQYLHFSSLSLFLLCLLCLSYTRTMFFCTLFITTVCRSLRRGEIFLFLLIHAYENSIYKLFVLESIEIASNDDKFLARFFPSGIYKSKSCFSSFFFCRNFFLLS